ncbi:hypothetical protein HK097_000383, partial [Rhizophlyctis rosea]
GQLASAILMFNALAFSCLLAERAQAVEKVEDIVEKRTEELKVALEDLKAEKQAAWNANLDKTVFMAFWAHEIRNPLHAITNLADFLMEESEGGQSGGQAGSQGSGGGLSPNYAAKKGPDKMRPDSTFLYTVRAIKMSSTYMLGLVNDVLEVGRLETGSVTLEPRVVDLKKIIGASVECAKELLWNHKMKFVCDVGTDLPQWIEADPVRLQQILNNLLGNAYRFTPEGGRISLSVHLYNRFTAPASTTSHDSSSPFPHHHHSTVPRASSSNTNILPPHIARRRSKQGMTTIFVTQPSESFSRGKRIASKSLSGESLGAAVSQIFSASGGFLKPGSTKSLRGASSGGSGTSDWVTLHFVVEDGCNGIEVEDVPALFEPYAQSNAKPLRQEGGSGLGLAITRRMVELMGGRIEVDTGVGTGTILHVFVPFRVAGRPEEASFEDMRMAMYLPDNMRLDAPEINVLGSLMNASMDDIEKELTEVGLSGIVPPKRPLSSGLLAAKYGFSGGSQDFISNLGARGILRTRESVSPIPPSHLSPMMEQILEVHSGTLSRGQGGGMTESQSGDLGTRILEEPASTINLTKSHSESLPKLVHATSYSDARSESLKPANKVPPAIRTSSTSLQTRTDTSNTLSTNTATSSTSRHTLPTSPSSTNPPLPSPLARILVVDDSSINRTILSRMLTRILPMDKWAIDEAVNGADAVEKVKQLREVSDNARRERDLKDFMRDDPKAVWGGCGSAETFLSPDYRIIFMDVVMPVMEGYEATKQIRLLKCHAPIVIVTANRIVTDGLGSEHCRGQSGMSEAEEAGANEQIGKPFTKELIREVLERYKVLGGSG